MRPINVDKQKFGAHEDIMPTLYNVSLSEKSYIAFGEDMFGVANSVAINSDVHADSTGLIWNNKFYKWGEFPLVNPDETNKDLNSLKKHANSSIVVSDFYLRQMYRKSQKSQQ